MTDTTPSTILGSDGAPAPKAEPASPEPVPALTETKKNEDENEEPDWNKVPFPIELFDNKIAIKRADVLEMTDGGIYIPESARRGEFRTMTGVVVASGPGIMKGDGSLIPLRVKVGETVVFEKYRSMTPVTVEGFTYHILAETDLLGKRAAGASVRVR